MSDKDDSKTQGDGTTTDDAEALKADVEKWKGLSRKHEQQAKDNKAELDKLKADGDASKSEQDKLVERITAAEERAKAAELTAFRYQVAARKGLTDAQAKRLQGSTIDELESDADELLAAFKPDTGEQDGDGSKDDADKGGEPGSGRPKERLRAGAANDAEPEETDPAKLVADIPRA